MQETEEKAKRLALRTLGFRLYYIRDVAKTIGLKESETVELEKKQPEMLRALLEGRQSWMPPSWLADLLLSKLTVTGFLRRLHDHFEVLHEFEKQGLNELALAVEGDPISTIKVLGEKVIPFTQEGTN